MDLHERDGEPPSKDRCVQQPPAGTTRPSGTASRAFGFATQKGPETTPLRPHLAPQPILNPFVCASRQTKTPQMRGFCPIAGAGIRTATFGSGFCKRCCPSVAHHRAPTRPARPRIAARLRRRRTRPRGGSNSKVVVPAGARAPGPDRHQRRFSGSETGSPSVSNRGGSDDQRRSCRGGTRGA